MSSTQLPVSVIIPTYNRAVVLQEALAALAQQTISPDKFEVIVVDDGSTDGTPSLAGQQFPFRFRCVRQENQGATVARNHGATLSQAEILVFIDDDVTVSPPTLEALVGTCCGQSKTLVMGALVRCSRETPSVYTSIVLDSPNHAQKNGELVELHFTECNTELLACRRSDFFEIGMLQDPTEGQGWPNWDDVDFGYRAHLHGFRLVQDSRALGEHWDYSIADRNTAFRRWYRASKSAVWLFQKHEHLQSYIPMLVDKTPPAWGHDPPALLARKVARHFSSLRLVLGSMDRITAFLENHYPSPRLLIRLYYWMQGAYMLRGYRDGLREFHQAGVRE